MIKRVSLAGLTLMTAALTSMLAPAVCASAAPAAAPGYLCSFLTSDGGGQWIGADDCTPTGGAPETGPIQGTFTITGRSSGTTVTCTQPPASFLSGTAETPESVTGYQCAPA
ncbi:hypothetical protein ACIQF6_33745 [Kitasatospora sp. NPDC092948]|uniref:hypothetical protein n=1 Tax=Kitasatospora sp. NPDC092948 TaxID=3364088 RepID=UPI003826947A